MTPNELEMPRQFHRSGAEIRAPSLPAWLSIGGTVHDTRLDRSAEVMAVAWPGCDPRQADRAWLRPLGGGYEWNPLVEDLGPVSGPAP